MAASGGENVSLAGPALGSVENVTVDEGNHFTRVIAASGSDPSRTLTFSLDSAPPGAAINPSTGALSWDPADGPITATVQVRVTDNGSPRLSDAKSFTITVNNVTPVAGVTGPAAGVRGQSLAYVFSANDASPVDQAAGFTYRVNWGDGTPVEIVTLT